MAWRGRFVTAVFDERGALRDLDEYPKLADHLARYRGDLEAAVHRAPWRAVVSNDRSRESR